ncbi:regulator of nonsense transcripts UPF3-like isoform X2 [Tripterygium wilfordii]|uniref:regulator of nonsense transcripts UPF3-like isoform X2 n=1 Tax=Tripterygium wilfordii TaxID=458696 RepID=UPI0018F82B71|nr:regulator of nonsense transcripts UPF3-like isoform X2 [Tripterygium wilfordii]
MKGGSDRTKVVLRHLPPAISEAMLMGQIDSVVAGRYNWVSFRPGKNSLKRQTYSRAYIDFKRPEDVLDFAEFFNGHVFVNEKGTQFKTIIEYAPSQRVPQQWSKKDGREGTIQKDPEYLEFLEFIAKPVENLPSAEIQLERREAERAGTAKDPPIITPLMDFVRQKRAAKIGSRQRLSSNGKLRSRSVEISGGSSSSASSKQGSEKKRGSKTMYVPRDSTKSISGKDKFTYMLVSRQVDQRVSAAEGEGLEDESGVSGSTDSDKKKVLLLKGKEREILHHQNMTTPIKNLYGPSAFKQNQRHEAAGKTVRSILVNKDSRLSQSGGIQSEQKIHTSVLEKDRRPPRSPTIQFVSKDMNGASDDKLVGDNLHGLHGEKEKRARNKDRPERVVWTPLRRSDGSDTSDESLSSSASQPSHTLSDSLEGRHEDLGINAASARRGEVKVFGSGRSSHSSSDNNGFTKHVVRRVTSHFAKDTDGSLVLSEGKSSRRSSTTSYGSHEKQVWVQKSGSGS